MESSETQTTLPPGKVKKKRIVRRIAALAVITLLLGSGLLWFQRYSWQIASIPILILGLGSFILMGYTSRWSAWTGFIEDAPFILVGYPRSRTLWDWLQLLIIPVVLTGSAYWFNGEQDQVNRQIATDQQQESVLTDYIDFLSVFLLNDTLQHSSPKSAVRVVARVRTLEALRELNGIRKGELVQFIYEAGLISRPDVIISLSRANLQGIELQNADLHGAELDNTFLTNADLRNVDLSGAELHDVQMIEANLQSANLSNSDLSGADLYQALVTQTQLAKATSLRGTIMPGGSRHP
jgi:hypothetical protein